MKQISFVTLPQKKPNGTEFDLNNETKAQETKSLWHGFMRMKRKQDVSSLQRKDTLGTRTYRELSVKLRCYRCFLYAHICHFLIHDVCVCQFISFVVEQKLMVVFASKRPFLMKEPWLQINKSYHLFCKFLYFMYLCSY